MRNCLICKMSSSTYGIPTKRNFANDRDVTYIYPSSILASNPLQGLFCSYPANTQRRIPKQESRSIITRKKTYKTSERIANSSNHVGEYIHMQLTHYLATSSNLSRRSILTYGMQFEAKRRAPEEMIIMYLPDEACGPTRETPWCW